MRNSLHLEKLVCSKCGREFSPDEPQTICEKCNAPLLPIYDLESVKDALSKEDLKGRRTDMWRYRELLPIKDERNIVSLGEGLTPVLKLEKLGEKLGIKNLYTKDDGLIPTGTFKARGLAMAVSKAKELGLKKLAMPTAGNAGAALAAYAAKAGIEAYVIMPEDAPLTCKLECYIFGARVYLVRGLISDAGRIVSEGKRKFGWFDVSTMKEPYRVEGKKTMGLEIAEQFNWEVPDVILYPTGGGTGIIGMWKAFNELKELGWIDEKMPRMISIQSEGCAPIVKAFKGGKKESEFWKDAKTIAAGIRVPKAFADFLILRALYESGGGSVAVSDKEILEASKEFAREGVFACPEGAATLAGLKQLLEEGNIDKDEKILLYNTGSGIKYPKVYSKNLKLELPLITSVNDIIT